MHVFNLLSLYRSRRVFPKTAEIGDIFRDNNDVLWVPFWYNRLLRWRPKCSTPDCVTMVIKEGSACRWCKCGMYVVPVLINDISYNKVFHFLGNESSTRKIRT